jgi:hypothetical protein
MWEVSSMTGLRRRIRALESGLAKRLEQPVRTDQAPGTGPEWLAAFEAMGREGQFEHEPDFPRALAFYREAIRDATAPAYFRHAGQPRPLPEPYRGRSFVRVDAGGNIISDGVDVNHGVNCRVTSAADEGWQWLAGMALRVQCGIPPVSEAEFQELTDWLTDVLRYTDSATFSGGVLDVGTAGAASSQTTPFHLWMQMREEGPRGLAAGEQAEAVRRLRARYSEGGMPPSA